MSRGQGGWGVQERTDLSVESFNFFASFIVVHSSTTRSVAISNLRSSSDGRHHDGTSLADERLDATRARVKCVPGQVQR